MAHLTRSQRDQLEILCRLGKRQTEMATFVGCSQSTVSRELARGSPPIRFSYRGHKAQAKAEWPIPQELIPSLDNKDKLQREVSLQCIYAMAVGNQ